ncbi:MAG TPA: heme-binding domain-containing protein [Chitinophagaceae bacterium]|nr:heme-binding domain-containing protein [Chitinophagaceae bacterium]
MFRKIMYVLLAAFIVIQFIHPAKNTSEGLQPNTIGNNYAIPADVKTILGKACNDCHSNNTRYPWYAKIQPVDWWLNKHVVDGKKDLNFDEFTNRAPRYQYHKMEEVIEMVKELEMPLKSYTWTHKDARLTSNEREKLTGWAQSVMDAMKVKYPVDSLIRPKR